MKKIKLIIAAVAMLSLVSSSAVYADGFAPGEGLYVGAFVASASGIVQPKVAITDNNATRNGGTYEATEGGLGLEGIEGGGMLGYGYKMGDLYAGLEGEIAWGDVEFKLTGPAVDVTAANMGGEATSVENITEVSAEKDWTGGAFGRIGYYLNSNTLLSFRGGVLVSKFDISYTGQSETFYGGGPSFGVDLASQVTAIDPNLSVRVGAVYTDYLTAPFSGIGTDVTSDGDEHGDGELTGSGLSARLGLQYSFFDVNSLF